MKIERNPAYPWIEIKINRGGESYALRRHSHTEVSLGIITSGRTVITVLNKEFELNSGDSIFIPADQIHLCSPDSTVPFCFYMIYMDRTWLERAFHLLPGEEKSGRASYGKLSGTRLDQFERLLEPWERGDSPSGDWEESYISFLGEILCTHRQLSVKEDNSLQNSLESIKKSLEIDPCQSLDDVCRNTEISKYTLIRGFTKTYGLTPHAFQLDIRIKLCIQWLKEGLDLARIAQDAGFSDQSHMQRTFKMYTGVTPGDYFSGNLVQPS